MHIKAERQSALSSIMQTLLFLKNLKSAFISLGSHSSRCRIEHLRHLHWDGLGGDLDIDRPGGEVPAQNGPKCTFYSHFLKEQSYQIVSTEVAKKFQKMPKSEFWQRNSPHFSNLLAKNSPKLLQIGGKVANICSIFWRKMGNSDHSEFIP